MNMSPTDDSGKISDKVTCGEIVKYWLVIQEKTGGLAPKI
jgi:hypothetical protein